MRLETHDTFLARDEFSGIYDTVFNQNFPWSFCPGDKINNESTNDLSMFTHILISDSTFVYKGAERLISPIMYKLKEIKKCELQCIRAKLNLFTKSPTDQRYGWHVDIEDDGIQYETIIFYLNTNNGGTEFSDGSIIRSAKNRALIVEGRVNHQSVGQTDTAARVLFNINYIKV